MPDYRAPSEIKKPHPNYSLVERLNGTLRERLKIEGMEDHADPARRGQRIGYNFVSPT